VQDCCGCPTASLLAGGTAAAGPWTGRQAQLAPRLQAAPPCAPQLMAGGHGANDCPSAAARSTAVEVALKMAFRKFLTDHPVVAATLEGATPPELQARRPPRPDWRPCAPHRGRCVRGGEECAAWVCLCGDDAGPVPDDASEVYCLAGYKPGSLAAPYAPELYACRRVICKAQGVRASAAGGGPAGQLPRRHARRDGLRRAVRVQRPAPDALVWAPALPKPHRIAVHGSSMPELWAGGQAGC